MGDINDTPHQLIICVYSTNRVVIITAQTYIYVYHLYFALHVYDFHVFLSICYKAHTHDHLVQKK